VERIYREERNFGRVVGVVTIAAAALQLWRGRPTVAGAAALIGVTLLLAGTWAPAVLVVPNRWWRRLGHALGWVNTRILLSLFFFLVITPVGLIMRLAGKDPLDLRGHGSTWKAYGERVRDPRHFERSF
jgi:hypothetical protein